MAQKQTSSILMLNDDCLLHIFGFLSMKEQLFLAGMSQRLKAISELYFRTRIVWIDYLNSEDKSNFYFKFGFRLEKLKPSGTCMHIHDVIHYVNDNFSELRWLNIKTGIIEFFQMGTYGNLANMSFGDCDKTESNLPVFSKSNRLQYLNVTSNKMLTGKCFVDFHDMKNLNMSYCIGINLTHFVKFCLSNKKLQSVNVMGAFNWDQQMVEHVAYYSGSGSLLNLEDLAEPSRASFIHSSYIWVFKRLEFLHFFCNTSCYHANLLDMFPISKFINLQTLKFGGGGLSLERMDKSTIFAMEMIKALCFYETKDLYDRDLIGIAFMKNVICLKLIRCVSLSNKGLLYLFEIPNKIEEVNICYNTIFDNETIFAIIDKIKQVERAKQVTLHVHGTSVTPSILKSQKYVKNSSLVQVIF